MFFAAVAMQLVHENVLELDEPVARWLPRLRDADRITLRDLLAHTSGMVLTPFVDDPAFRWTPDQVLERSGAPACEPATCFRYSDNNYAALGQVIASATGRPIEDVLRGRIFDPLDLGHIWLQGFESSRGRVAPAEAGGLVFDDPDGNTPSTEFVTRTGASGALAATAIDVARFADALFRGRVVDRKGLAAMTDFGASADLPCPEPEFCGPGYGLGVQFNVIDGWRVQGHSGSTGTLVAFFPKQRVTLAVLTNGRGNPYLAANALADVIPTIRNELDLFTIRADGTHPSRLAHGEPRRSGASMSPDGTHVLSRRPAPQRRPGHHGREQ
jgi:D-alanyl-D-alanine carboxypeptidase